MVEGMKALKRNEICELVTLLLGKKLVGYEWVFIVKYKANDSIEI